MLALQRRAGNRATAAVVPPTRGRGSPVAVVQSVIEVRPTDIDANSGKVSDSTFNQVLFTQVWVALHGTGFRNTLNAYQVARQQFMFAHLNPLLVAQPDVPSLATAMVAAASAGAPGALAALTPHVGDLVQALGDNAPTNAGAVDVGNFNTLKAAGGVVMSRQKAVPSTMNQAALNGASGATNTALNLLIARITARNNALDQVASYIAPGAWLPRARASMTMAGIRSPHQNGAGWLPAFAAAPLDAAVLAATGPAGVALQADHRPARQAIGNALVAAAAAAAAEASDVETTVDASGSNGLINHFYRSVFWPSVPTKAARVELAWARFATDFGTLANCPYIEFAGGGAASRFVWDYVNDRFFLSAHYNMVGGYNPFFRITGTASTK